MNLEERSSSEENEKCVVEVSLVDPRTFQPLATTTTWDANTRTLVVDGFPHIAAVQYLVAVDKPDFRFDPHTEFEIRWVGPGKEGKEKSTSYALDFDFRDGQGLAVRVVDGQLFTEPGVYNAEVWSLRCGRIGSCSLTVTVKGL